MSELILDDEINAAIARIALTSDGRVFHLGLQRALMALSPSPDSGALQTFEGGRRFAQQIKAAMDKSIAEDSSGGRTGKDTSSGGAVIVIAPRGAVRTSSARGTRRRVTADTRTE